jgi:hypothetical protein
MLVMIRLERNEMLLIYFNIGNDQTWASPGPRVLALMHVLCLHFSICRVSHYPLGTSVNL